MIIHAPVGKLTCRIENASSGGYGVEVPEEHLDLFTAGRVLQVEVDQVVMEVRVAHVRGAADRRIAGVERIADLEDRAAIDSARSSWTTALRGSQGESIAPRSTWLREVSIALGLAVVLVAYFFLPGWVDQRQGKKPTRASKNTNVLERFALWR